jgi:hypothetical protein
MIPCVDGPHGSSRWHEYVTMARADVGISLSCGTLIFLPLPYWSRVFLFGWSAVFLPRPETSLAGWLAAVKEGLAPSRGHRALVRREASELVPESWTGG